MRPDFTVSIVNDKRPLEGVSIEITRFADGNPQRVAFAMTDAEGKARVLGLSPGDYWLKAELLGITATDFCFHVNSAPSKKARRVAKYEWGDWAPSIAGVAGTLMDCQPAKGNNPVMNLVRCTQVPVVAARFELINPITRTTLSTLSDENGSFAFPHVPSGKYVLHVEGGKALTREYDETDQLIKVNPTAQPNTLLLIRRESGAGSCGGTDLEFRASTKP